MSQSHPLPTMPVVFALPQVFTLLLHFSSVLLMSGSSSKMINRSCDHRAVFLLAFQRHPGIPSRASTTCVCGGGCLGGSTLHLMSTLLHLEFFLISSEFGYHAHPCEQSLLPWDFSCINHACLSKFPSHSSSQTLES